MYSKTSQTDFLNAARQLKLKGENSILDRNQLKYLLFEILAYPSVAKAEQHDRSNKIGSNDLLIRQAELSKKNTADLEICNCCGLLLQNKQIPFSTKFDELNLGFGVILFFKDIFFYMNSFFLIFLIYSIYSICTNVLSFNQSQVTRMLVCKQLIGCQLSMIGAGSKVLNVEQQRKYLNIIQCFIGMGLIAAWGIAQIIKTHLQQKQIADIETKKISASDFTLMIDGYPKLLLQGSKQESINQLNQIFQTFKNSQQFQAQHSFEVVNVNIARPIFLQNQKNQKQREITEQQLYKMQNIFRHWVRQRAKRNSFQTQFHLRTRIYDEYHSYYSSVVENALFPNIQLEQRNLIFVTFRNSKARQQIQSYCKPPSILRFWKWFQKTRFPVKNVHITKAPQPDEIKWNNIGFSKKQRVIRKILVWLATVGLIILSLLVSVAVSYVRQKSTWISLLISLIVTFVNIGIQIVIINLTYSEHQITQSWQQSNIALKIGIGQLVNSICVPILVTAFSQSQQSPKSWLKSNGLVEDVFFIALLNILIPLTTLIDPYQYFLKLKRWYFNDPQRRLQMFGQEKLNAYYGNYKFDIGYQYAFLIKTIIFTSFFLCMQPLIAIFAPVALGLYYLSMKKKLFYHFARPGYHFATTNRTANNILLLALPAFGLGSLFVNNGNPQSEKQILNKSTLALNYIITLIGIGFLIVVPFKIFYCCITRPKVINKVYENCRMMLYNDYDRANPITKSSAINEFESYIKSLEQSKNLGIEGQLVKLHLSKLKTEQLRKSSRKHLHPYEQIQQEKEKKESDIMYNYDINYYNKIARKNKTGMNQGEEHIMDESFIKNQQFSQNKF